MLILSAALFVLGRVGYAIVHPSVPVFEAMGAVSLIALAANGTCLALLWKHRSEDINMSSVWECSRNDIASNLTVLVAAALVWTTGAAWPDLAVGLALAALLLWSAANVCAGALKAMRAAAPASAEGEAIDYGTITNTLPELAEAHLKT